MAADPPDWHLATARTGVRPATLADAAALHWIRGTMPYDPQTRTLRATRAMIAAMARTPTDAPGWQQFAVVDAADAARVLGDIGVQFDYPGPRQAELGFAMHPDCRGQGLAREAVGAMVERLFAHGLHRVEALTDARNQPAQRLLDRLGFRREAHYVASWPTGDGWSDEIGFALLSTDARPAGFA